MQQRRLFLWLWISAGVFLLGVLAQIGIRLGPQLPPSQQLSDGSVVRISKVFYGKSQKIVYGNLLAQVIGRILPDAVSKRVGIRTSIIKRPATSFVYIETFGNNHLFSFSPGGMPFETSVWMTDDVGNAFYLPPALKYRTSNNKLVEIFYTPLISHRATQFHLYLTQLDPMPPFSRQTAEFVVPNPAPYLKPIWNAGQLPLTNESDGLTTVFSSFKTVALRSHRHGFTNLFSKNLPQLLFFEHGLPSTNWSVESFSVQDEEGNALHDAGIFSPLETYKWRFVLQGIPPALLGNTNRIVVFLAHPEPVPTNSPAKN